MGTIKNKLNEMTADIEHEVDRVAAKVEHAEEELEHGLVDATHQAEHAEAKLEDDLDELGARAKARAKRAKSVLERAADEVVTEVRKDEHRVDAFILDVVEHLRADLRPVAVDALRELDVLLGRAQSRVRTELSKRADSQPRPGR